MLHLASWLYLFCGAPVAKQAKAAQLMLMKRKRVDESDGSESEEKDPILQWGKSDEYYGAAEGKEFDVGLITLVLCGFKARYELERHPRGFFLGRWMMRYWMRRRLK